MPPISHDEIVFVDGGCLFCQGRVRWLLRHDRDRRLSFGSLQGETAARLLAHTGLTRELSSLAFVIGADGPAPEILTKSRAVAAMAARLPIPWRLGGLLALVPRPLADAAYDWIARRRYRWGRSESCELPVAAEGARFLS